MIIITWVVLIANILGGVLSFISTFTGGKVSDRLASFVATVISVLTCILSIYIIRG